MNEINSSEKYFFQWRKYSLFVCHNGSVLSFLLNAFLCILILQKEVFTQANFVDQDKSWRITFYTGSKLWSGTDSIINVQIYGDKGKSDVMQIIPNRRQMEARTVDTFHLGLLDSSAFGQIKSITISKQHSYAFFNDWELIKVEITDPTGKIYLFKCFCWLTTLKYKRNIELFSVDGIEIVKSDTSWENDHRRRFRIFPLTVSILFILLMIIIFTYFGNLIFKNWRENSHIFTQNFSRRHRRSRNQSTRSIHRSNALNSQRNNQNDLYKDDDEEDLENRANVYNFTDDLTNIETNISLNRSQNEPSTVSRVNNGRIAANLTNEDKPPDYKELFPMQTIQTASNQGASNAGEDNRNSKLTIV